MESEHSSSPSRRKYVPLAATVAASIFVSASIIVSDPQVAPLSTTMKASVGQWVEITHVGQTQVPARELPPPPELSAQSYLIQIIGEKNPLLKLREWKRLKPASLTKLITAAIAMEHLPADSLIPL